MRTEKMVLDLLIIIGLIELFHHSGGGKSQLAGGSRLRHYESGKRK